MECKIDGCEREVDVKKRRLCKKHYNQMMYNPKTYVTYFKGKKIRLVPQLSG